MAVLLQLENHPHPQSPPEGEGRRVLFTPMEWLGWRKESVASYGNINKPESIVKQMLSIAHSPRSFLVTEAIIRGNKMDRLRILTAVLLPLFLLPGLTGCATRTMERSTQSVTLAELAVALPPVRAVAMPDVLVPAPIAHNDEDIIQITPLEKETSISPSTPPFFDNLRADVEDGEKPTAIKVLGPPVDVWDRLRRGFAMPPLKSPAAEQFARHFADIAYLTKGQDRTRRYLFFILEEVEKRGMPTELVLLPFVESSMNPQARSPVGAMGAWQFMPGTGRRFDMRISRLVDDRKNVMESTRAALDYLQQLHDQFGDWHLSLAAYNWGEGNVARAQIRNRVRGQDDDYMSLSMPTETRNYVPQLEALKRLIADPEFYGALLPEIPNRPYFQQVAVPGDIDTDIAIRWSGVSEAEFFALNPSVRRPLLMAAATPTLLLPFDAAARYAARQKGYAGKRANWTTITLAKNQRVESIAAKHGSTSRMIRNTNGIPVGMKPTAGSTLLVPILRGDRRSVGEATVTNASLSFVPDVVQVKLRARKGDTLSTLARRSRLDATDLARWNKKLHTRTRLVAGQTVIAFVHPDLAVQMAAQKRRKA